jgi:sugar phosphate permease
MWSILALAFVIVYIHRVAPSVVADQLMEAFAVKDGAVLGSLAGMYFYVYAVMQLPSGLLADSLGPRMTVFAGMILAGAGSLFFAAAPTLFLAFTGRFLVGLGVSVIFVSVLKFQSVWFLPAEFAFITGMTVLMGNAGAVLAATPLAYLVDRFGWRFSFVVIGLLSLVVAVACRAFVRDLPPAVYQVRDDKPLGQKFLDNIKQMGLVLKNKNIWPPFFVVFGVYGTLVAFSGIWGVPYLMQVYGYSRIAAANLMLMIALGMIAGSPIIGLISDRIRRRKLPYLVFVVSFTLAWSVLVFWNGGRPPEGILYQLYFLLGFFGGAVAITFALGKELNPPQMAGMAIATVNIGAFLGISLQQPLLGYLLDVRWHGVFNEGVKVYNQNAYFFAFRFCLYPLALAVVAAFLVKETNGENCYVAR